MLVHYPIESYFYSSEQTIHTSPAANGSESITLLQGYCYDRCAGGTKGRLLNAGQVHDMLLAGKSVGAVQQQVGGEYAIVHISPLGEVLLFNDVVGLEHVYFCNAGLSSMASNRLALIELERKREDHFDFVSMLSLPLTAFVGNCGTYIDGVSRLAQDHYLQSQNNTLIEIRQPPHFYHYGRMLEGFDSGCFEQLFELGLEEATSWLTRATRDRERIQIAITGGKDSRAVLALCLMAGLRDKIELFTNGVDEHPEVIAGRQIAALLDLPHTTRAPMSPKPLTALEFQRRFAVHAYQSEGLMVPWDLQNRGPYPVGLAVGGFCGEFLRPFQKSSVPLADHPLESIVRYFDPLNLINREAKLSTADRIYTRLQSFLDYGANQDDLANIYHISDSYTGWLGASLRLNAYAITTIKPLYSYYWNNLSFALPADIRATELIHYSIIERCSQDLLELPLFTQRWDTRLAQFGKTSGLGVEPLAPVKGLPVHGSWQHQLNTDQRIRQTTLALLKQKSSSELWQYVDRKRLLNLLERHKFAMQELHSLFGFLGVLFKYERIELPRKMFKIGQDQGPEDKIVLSAKSNQALVAYSCQHVDNLFTAETSADAFAVDTYALDLLSCDTDGELLALCESRVMDADAVKAQDDGRPESSAHAPQPSAPTPRGSSTIARAKAVLKRAARFLQNRLGK